jgi:hypothetical protein
MKNKTDHISSNNNNNKIEKINETDFNLQIEKLDEKLYNTMKDHKEDIKSIHGWLKKYNLEVYLDELIIHGFGRRDTIKYLNKDSILKMNIPYGFSMLILEKLHEILK